MCRGFFSLSVLVALFAAAFGDSTQVNCANPAPSVQPCDTTRCNIGNVCYVIDQSDSITTQEYEREQEFVSRFAAKTNERSASNPLNSLVVFSSEAELVQAPTNEFSVFEAAVRGDRLFYESTAISEGLRMCQDQLRRAEGSKTIVLVTDGQTSPAEKELTKNVAADIKNAGIKLLTAGIGCDANEELTKEIASSAELFIDLNNERPCQAALNAIENICEPEPCPEVTTDPCVPISCQQAFDRCAFTFAGKSGLATFDVTGTPDTSFTPMVISKNPNVHLGVLNMNDLVPEFIDESGVKQITEFGTEPFTSTHFKPYSIEGTRGSGVGHQKYHSNQKQLAQNRCVRVFFSHIQVLNQASNLSEVPENHCVVFRTM